MFNPIPARFVTSPTAPLTFLAIVVLLTGCETNEVALRADRSQQQVFTTIDAPHCQQNRIDLGFSVEVSRKALRTGYGAVELLAHYRDLRCLSARDFRTAYGQMLEALPSAGEAPELAPLVFLYFDMGGRLIDGGARRWLLTGLKSSAESEQWEAVQFYSADGVNLRRVPRELNVPILQSLAGSTWLTRCSFQDMSWTTLGFPYCPSDDVCPVLRHMLNEEQIASLGPQEREEICDELCRLAPPSEDISTSPPAFGGLCGAESGDIPELPEQQHEGVLACLTEYLEAQPNPNRHVACILETRPDRLAPITDPDPDVVLTVSDRCKLANDVIPDPQEERDRRRAEALEQQKAQLEHEKETTRQEFREEMEQQFPVPPTPDDPDYLHYKNVHDHYQDKIDKIDQELKEVETELEEIEERQKKREAGTTRCSQDDFSCSDNCSIQDQQRRAFFECVTPGTGGSSVPVTPIDRDDPSVPDPPPEVTDPPDDGPPDDPAWTQLVNCVSDVLAPEENECAVNLRCLDGSRPTVNEVGFCACPESDSLPGELPCSTVLECPIDEPCSCPDGPDGLNPTSGQDSGTLLIIER